MRNPFVSPERSEAFFENLGLDTSAKPTDRVEVRSSTQSNSPNDPRVGSGRFRLDPKTHYNC